MTGTIFNIQRYSINDGPGIRTTVFLKGCPLSCKWCHNPESISPDKEILIRENRCIRCGECFLRCNYFAVKSLDGEYITDQETCAQCGRCVEVCFTDARAIVGKEMTVDDVMNEVEKDVIFYNQSGGGVTFSGGEPFLQHEFLIELLKASKKKNLHTAIDTSGFTSSEILQKASRFIDLYLYDIKTLDDTLHKSFTGVSNRLILENLKKLLEWQKNIIVRIPLIPGINNNLEQMRQIGKFISSLQQIQEVHVLPYHRTGIEKYNRLGVEYSFKKDLMISKESLNKFQDELLRYIPTVVVGD